MRTKRQQWRGKLGAEMLRNSLVRKALVASGIASLMLSSTLVAGAATTTGTYNAANAKLVPTSLAGKTLQIATDPSYAPDESMSGSNIVGFDIDLMNAVGVTLGLKTNHSKVTFDNIIAGLLAKKYQVGNSSFTDNMTREKQVNFVDYFQAGEGVYAKSSSMVKFTGFSSFCGLKIAVEKGTVEETDGAAALKACTSNKTGKILSFATQTDANTAVSSGQADVGFLDSQIAGYVVSTSKGAFKLLGSAVNVAPYGFATSKTPEGKALALAIQAALKTLVANGTYAAILAKWGVSSGALTPAQMVLNGAKS